MSHTEMVTTVTSINPHDNTVIAHHALTAPDAIDASLQCAYDTQRSWARTGFEHRAAILTALADELRRDKDALAEMVTAEMGKPLREARAEIEKSAWACEYYAEHGAEHLSAEAVATEWSASYVQFPPLGVVLAVMPWNFPVWQVVRAAAPALMAGNAVVLKHASNVTGTALLLRDVFARVCPSLLEVLVVRPADLAAIIHDDRIAGVTFTGSEEAGIQVATTCAQCLKPSVLELGGSDPFIVLADADVEAAARAAVTARYANAGQSCVAAKRFIVVDAVAPAFEEAFTAAVGALVVGDPRDDDVDLGPMARTNLRDELADQVSRGLRAGGRVLTGGVELDGPGAYYAPTVIGSVTTDNPLAWEETFGPAAAVLRAQDEASAIAVANASPFGLSSSIWTADVARAQRLSPEIEAGAVFVNTLTASDPRMPFGGIKRSGWGRELGSFGIREFVNIQAVTVAPKQA